MIILTVNHHSLLPDVLVYERGHFTRVGPCQIQGRPLQKQGPVPLEPVVMNHVVEVQVGSELLPDDLRPRHLSRQPLEEWSLLIVEVPFDFQLEFLFLLIIVVTI